MKILLYHLIRNSFFLLICNYSFAQSFQSKIGLAKSHVSDSIQILELLKLEKPLIAKYYQDTLAELQYFVANRFLNLSQVDSSKLYFQKSFKNFENSSSTNIRKERVKSSLAKLQTALDSVDFYLSLIAYDKMNKTSAWIFSEAANYHSEIYNSIGEFQAAKLILDKIESAPHYAALESYEKLEHGIFYMRALFKLDGKEAENLVLKKFNKLEPLAFVNSKLILLSEWAKLHLELFNYYEYTGQDKKALDFVNEYLEKYKKYNARIPEATQLNFYTNKLNILDKLGLYDEMPAVIDQALFLDMAEDVQNEVAFRNNYALTLMHQDNYEGALAQIQIAFDSLGGRPTELTAKTLYTKDIISIILDELRIHLHFAQQEKANKTKVLLLKLIKDKLQVLALDQSHLSFKSELNNLSHLLLDAAIQLDDPGLFWEVNEFNKATLTLKNLNTRNNPKIRALQKAKDSIEYLQIISPENYDQDEINEVNQSILTQVSKTKNKQLAKISFSTLTDINQNLAENQCLVTFQKAKNTLYAMVVDRTRARYIKLEATPKILENARKLTHAISQPNTDYEYLVENLQAQLILPLRIESYEDVIVIPDGELHQIPFSILASGYTTFSYALSGSLWMKNKQTSTKIRKSTFCAPDYGNTTLASNYTRSGITPLIYSQKEVTKAQATLGGKIIKADKQEIITAISRSDLFHFSGHGIVSSESSKHSILALDKNISGYDHVLTNSEIANLKSKAAMVVLSACETGLGENQTGEGVNSLTKGFIQAGAASVVHTLWKVNDQSTSQIMAHFYGFLKQGYRKSVALDRAKKKYLETAPDNGRHPYYWAGITVVGSNEPLLFSSHKKWWWIAGTILILAAGGLFLKNKSASKTLSSSNL